VTEILRLRPKVKLPPETDFVVVNEVLRGTVPVADSDPWSVGLIRETEGVIVPLTDADGGGAVIEIVKLSVLDADSTYERESEPLT